MLKTEIMQLLEDVALHSYSEKLSKSLGSDESIERDKENMYMTTTPQDGAQAKKISATMIFSVT